MIRIGVAFVLSLVLPPMLYAGGARLEIAVKSADTATVVLAYEVSSQEVADLQSSSKTRLSFERRALGDYANSHGYSRKAFGKENYKLMPQLKVQTVRLIAPGIDKELYRYAKGSGKKL